MKKKLISLALVLVMVAAVALPVAARAGDTFSFNGAVVSIYGGRSDTYASASTTLSLDGGMVQCSLVMSCYNYQTGASRIWDPVGPMDLRESHLATTPPANFIFRPSSSLHYFVYRGVDDVRGLPI